MPTFRHGRNAKVVVNALDLSAYFNEGSIKRSMEPADVTTFANNSHTYIPGLMDGTISLGGFFDGSASAVDATLAGALQAATDTLVTFAPEGMAIGRNTYVTQAQETSYDVSAPVSDAVSISAEFQSNVGLWSAESLHDLEADSTSTNSTSVDAGASSAIGGAAFLHVTANTRSSNTTIKVEHSSDNTSWAALATFTVVPTNTTTSERLVVASGTTINRYLRAASTLSAGTGAITYTLSFARGAIQ